MKILVTGGYGFIGSHLVERLIKEKHDVTIIDDLSTGNESNLKNNVTFFKIGIEDTKCEKIFADFKFDVVVHLALKELSKEDENIYHSNTVGLSNVLFFSQKYHVNKVIVLSSYQVYGKQDKFPIAESRPIDLESEKAENYLEREYFCKKYRDKGLNVAVLRLASIYGPRQAENFISGTISKIYEDKAEKHTVINELKDYIYISDAVEAIYRTCEKQTSNILNISSSRGIKHSELQEIISDNIESNNRTSFNYIDKHTRAKYLLDNEKACIELDWSPKYSIEEGIKKTVDWSIEKFQSDKNKVLNKEETLLSRIKSKWLLSGAHKYIENLILFTIFAILMVIIDRRLFINLDLFIVYIVIVNMYYGWWQGIISIFLSIIAYMAIKMGYENITMAGIFNNISQELYIVMYFILGGIAGYLADRMRVEKSELENELNSTKEDLYFTIDMYNKSIEIKNSLQETIESNEDSLGKIYNIISKLNNVPLDEIFSEAATIFSEMFKTKSVHIYYLDSLENIKLAALVGLIKHRKSLLYKDYDFLESVIKDGNIFINEDFTEDYPMVCAPIIQDGFTTAVVFLDELEFTRLTYQFLNTLKVLTYLIANSITRATECENGANNKKDLSNTIGMKKDWIELIIKEKQVKLSENDLPICLLIFNKDNNEKNIKLYKRVKEVFSESDYIVEVDDTKIVILLFDSDKEEAMAIKTKLKDLGILDTRIESLRRIM